MRLSLEIIRNVRRNALRSASGMEIQTPGSPSLAGIINMHGTKNSTSLDMDRSIAFPAFPSAWKMLVPTI